MENQLDFYKSFHTHPINQGIHTICIPSIVLCVLNYASLLRIHFEFLKGKPKTISSWYNTSLEDLISIFYTIQYYRTYGIKIGSVMFRDALSVKMITDPGTNAQVIFFIDRNFCFSFDPTR